MMQFVDGEGRTQVTPLPDCLDDDVSEGNPARAFDAFVEELDLRQLSFAGADPATTGRPAYHPPVPLEIYIHGSLRTLRHERTGHPIAFVQPGGSTTELPRPPAAAAIAGSSTRAPLPPSG